MTLVAVFDPSNTSGIVTTADRAFWSTLPYILIAVGLIAYLKSTGAEVMIAAAFEGREIKMIVMAALMGGLAPFCSCEVIPFIAALLSLGVFGGGVVKLMRDSGYLSDIRVPRNWAAVAVAPRSLRVRRSGSFGWHRNDALSLRLNLQPMPCF